MSDFSEAFKWLKNDKQDRQTVYLEKIKQAVKFKKWFF